MFISVNGTIVPMNVEDYDEGDWHIRKWTNGYLEMILKRTTVVEPGDWKTVSGVDSFYFVDPLFTGDLAYPALPIPMTAVYDTSNSVVSGLRTDLTRSGFWTMMQESRTPLTSAPNVSLVRWGPVSQNFTITIATKVSGLWKEQDTSVTLSALHVPMGFPAISFNVTEITSTASTSTVTLDNPSCIPLQDTPNPENTYDNKKGDIVEYTKITDITTASITSDNS